MYNVVDIYQLYMQSFITQFQGNIGMLQVQACATHQMGWGMAQQVASHMG